ncbi:hypothetical protein [Burkholderia sp. Ac-20365]|uniref:hypothetical protein n=1 Tax=Burkholderia sp. Ac-20365 TaxID=2703897 RepID=UPI00197B9ADC
MSEQLWCVHFEGLDDFVAASSQEVAEREASAINAYIDSVKDNAPTRLVRASAIVWPFSPAGHARSLETDWQDLQRMPHRQAGQDHQRERDTRATSIFRRIKALFCRA